MKTALKIIAGTSLAAACALLIGCAAPPRVDPRVAEVVAWREKALGEAMAGRMKWSAYYAEYFGRLSNAPNAPERNVIMKGASEMLPIARQYEAGQLTEDQFNDARRAAILRVDEALAQVNHARAAEARQQAAEARRAQLEAQELINKMLPAPAPFKYEPPKTTRCVTRRDGERLETDCSDRGY